MIKSTSLLISGLVFLAAGCSLAPSTTTKYATTSSTKGASTSTSSGGGGSSSTSPGVPGVPGSAVPTANAVIARINTALAGNTNPTSGNFSQAIAQLSGGLPQTSNPMTASGLDKVPLLGYAACSDVKLSNYGITSSPTATGAIAANSALLVAAGVKMIDQITGGLGSSGPVSSQVAAAFTTLVSADAAVTGETTQMAFISVCMAAVSFAVTGTGF